jgi:ribosomal protein S18 acetylase RimI-like enzyme
MPTDLQTTSLPSTALDEAAALQARTFLNDPLVEFVLPAEAMRRACLPLVMRVVLAYGSRFGHVHTDATSMFGHAVWLPPGSGFATGYLEPVSLTDLRQQVGELAFSRFTTLLEQTALRRGRLVPEPHWYLMMIGVDPAHQGHGVGGALLQPILTCADVEHFSCYAETASERSLGFYRRHGFEVTGEHRLQPDGPLVWMMIRGPRRHDHHVPRSHLERKTIGAARRVRR